MRIAATCSARSISKGKSVTPADLQWQYCCNCEHFCPVDFDQYGLQRCPVCTRKSSLLYLCDRCYVISFESNTPLQTKNFTLTPEGAPEPSCPGCLRPASADLHEHTCDEVNTYVCHGPEHVPDLRGTARHRAGFSFDSGELPEANETANKINVTFDYETGVVHAG